ncbi:MAG: adenosylhomocysteinase, partial [Thermoplasmata archaeon]|nr:adenosylhomocysteinase [Thermoplasmata archaeon]
FVVGGYGWCGRGIAMRARGMGARVMVTEIDPVKAVEARMDGFDVMPMAMAAPHADFIVTATGCKNIVAPEHFPLLKDGCIMANSGHFDNEIDRVGLDEAAQKRRVRESVDEYLFPDGKKLYLLAEGRLVNLAAGQGHPVEIMDMSFAIQALCAKYMAENHGSLSPAVYKVPEDIDEHVAWLELDSMAIDIDQLTPEQEKYLNSWQEGT